METRVLTQTDTRFTPVDQGVRFRGADCGAAIAPGQQMIPVQWAPGSTGSVGVACGCAARYDWEADVSDDGMAVAHWPKAG